MNTRLLGTIGIVSSPMLFIQGVRSGFDLSAPDRVDAALGLVFLVGWVCSVVALRVLRATGTGRAGAVLLAVQAVGLSLAALQQVQDFMLQQNPDNTLYQIANLAWPVSVLLMLVVGGLTVAAGRLTGWWRWAPLLWARASSATRSDRVWEAADRDDPLWGVHNVVVGTAGLGRWSEFGCSDVRHCLVRTKVMPNRRLQLTSLTSLTSCWGSRAAITER